MRLNLFLFGVCSLFLLFLVPFVSGLIGCCCDPVTFNGTFEDSETCVDKNFIFVGVPPAGQTCSQFCNASKALPSPEANVTPVTGCGAPGFRAAPANVVVSPVKGEKALRVSFDVSCPVDYTEIYRCAGQGCSDYTMVDTVAGGSSFFDRSGLEFSKVYRYKVVVHYSGGSDSNPGFSSGSMGDLECWFKQTDDEFCIHQFYYDVFEDYLKSFGYKSVSASDFTDDFSSGVVSVFSSRFNKAWSCNSNNLLFQKTGAVSCSAGQICVSSVPRAKCVTPSACEQGGVFGLFSSFDSCESQDYCFFDRSATNVDFCFECSPRMSCSDYHSKLACEHDSCGAGECEWSDVFSSIGVGVCMDKRFDNCPQCSQTPDTSISSSVGFNRVYDVCSPAKADVLSSEDHECFFNKNTFDAVSCNDAVCDDFSVSQCGSPEGGIQLGSDNSLVAKSSDECGIGVCYYSDSQHRCFKDADANQIPDCGNRECEKDFFAPVTSALVLSSSGRDDFIDFRVRDKISRHSAAQDMTNHSGYLTFVCVGDCGDVGSFVLVNSSRLNINDLVLQDGQRKIADLASGSNLIRFFSVDPNRNVEVVKEVSFIACDNCAGPKVLDFRINQGNVIGGDYYTNTKRPVFRIVFNEPAELSAVSLSVGGSQFSFSAEPSSGLNYEYILTPLVDLPDARYLFNLNAEDNNGIFMDSPLSFNLSVDTVVPVVSVLPEDNSFFNVGTVDVRVSCSEPVLLNASVDDVVFVNNYLAKRVHNSINSILESNDSRIFLGEVSGLSSGKKVLSASVSDFAGNKAVVESVFFITTGVPDFRLKSPSFGVSSSRDFDVVVESSGRVECRYLYDVPVAPPASEFAYLSKFDITGDTEHVLRGFGIPANESENLLYVYCKAGDFAPVRKEFEFSFDDSPPVISNAFVYPDVISDYDSPELFSFTALLKVQTSEPTFCRYSPVESEFENMEFDFPGFGEVLKKAHVINVSVFEEGNFAYFVDCEDIAELGADSVMLNFSVDTSVPFSVVSISDRYQNSSPLFLRVETNKNSFCYYGEDVNDISECFGDCNFGLSHVSRISKSAKGDYSFFVRCNNGAGGAVSDVLSIDITYGAPPANVSPADLSHCYNSVLDGSETDIDCGGACPACAKGLNCVEDADCVQGLFCVKSVCSEQDSDEDGVPDVDDSCPGTPAGEIADSRGCSKSQRDSDGDGMDDSWELSYGLDPEDSSDADEDLDGDGLSNLEEFNQNTDPSVSDTDGDGWSDGKEVAKGFNPLDAESHPKSMWGALLVVVLVIVVVAGLAVAVYFGYKYYLSLPSKPKPEKEAAKMRAVPEDKFKGLRKMVKIGPPRPERDHRWVSFEDFVKRIKKPGPPDVWSKLQRIKAPKKEKEEHKKKKPKKDVLDSLRGIAKKRGKNA